MHIQLVEYMASVEERLKPVASVGGAKSIFEEMKFLKEMRDHSVSRKQINSELWHACAGPLVTLPQVGSLVYYFPQGHSEQVAISTKRASTAQIPNYPNLPPQLLCQVHNVTLHADKDTDEIYAQMSLQPVSSDKEVIPVPDFCQKSSKHPTEFFCKTLTASDTSTHGGFSIPRRAAEKLFPQLDFSMQPPSQELVVRDLHDNTWTFRHIYRGQPKRHLLTTGWSMFVGAKRLRAGDAVIFVRDAKSQLLLGVRRATRQQATLPSSVLSADSMQIGILAAAAHAAANQTPFTIFYNPRACSSEFVIPFARYQKAVFGAHLSVGMRFGMMFETEESNKRRYMGTIIGISDMDPRKWPNSKWRCLQVEWDEPGCGDKRDRVSPWEIDTPESLFIFPSLPANIKRPFHSAFMGAPAEWEGLVNKSFAPNFSCPNVSGMWSDQLIKRPVEPQNKLAFTGLVQEANYPVNQKPEESHPATNSAVMFQGKAEIAANHVASFRNSKSGYAPEIVQLNQCNEENVAEKQMNPQCFVNDLGVMEQTNSLSSLPECPNSLLQYPEQVDPPLCNSLEPFRNQESFWDSQLISTKCATQTSIPAPLLSQQDINNLTGDNSNQSDIYSCLNLDGSNSGSTVIDPTSVSSLMLDGLCGMKNSDFQKPSDCLVGNFSISPNQDVQSQITSASLPDSHAFSSIREYADNSGGASSSNVDFDDNSLVQQTSWNQLAPRFRTYTKIQKAGSVGRSIDVSAFTNYNELRSEIERMFGLEGLLNDLGSGWKLVYVDFENDVLLVGDDPWEEFVGCVRCIRILSPSEVKRMGEEGMQLLNSVSMQEMSASMIQHKYVSC